MSGVVDLKKLEKLTTDGSGMLDKPWQVQDGDGQWWVCATNKLAMVGIMPGVFITDVAVAPKDSGAAKLFLSSLAVDGDMVDMPALREWLGRPAWGTERKCPDCNGTGETNRCPHCDRTDACETCNGDGWLGEAAPVRRGRLMGAPVNRNLMVRALSCVPGDDAGYLHVGAVGGGAMFTLAGDGWRVIVMGLNDIGEKLPEFEPVVAEVAA